MRVRNKEIRAKRHRKEQIIKDAIRTAKAEAAGGSKKEKKAAKPASKPAAKKAAPKKTEEAPAAE
ncbi:MAG: hypothetical protein JST12_17605 [Armatimonadetes bacterium]|nr:hypothetical protein [Armatimonadota bacterium]MBS1703484.1 hypothetical protein [Armatimonadota bacterium]